MRRSVPVSVCAMVLVAILTFGTVNTCYRTASTVRANPIVIPLVEMGAEVLLSILGVMGVAVGGVVYEQNEDSINQAVYDYAMQQYELERTRQETQGQVMQEWSDFITDAYNTGKVKVTDAVKSFIDSFVSGFSDSDVVSTPTIMSLVNKYMGNYGPYYVVYLAPSRTSYVICYFSDSSYLSPYGDRAHLMMINRAVSYRMSDGYVNDWSNSDSRYISNEDIIFENCGYGYGTGVIDGFVDFDPLGMINKKLDELDKSLKDLKVGSLDQTGVWASDLPVLDQKVWDDVVGGVTTWDKVIEDAGVSVWDDATSTPVIGTMPNVGDIDKPDIGNPDKPGEDSGEEELPDSGSVGGGMVADLSKLFPFCIPFDLIRAVKVFNASPEIPNISWTFHEPFSGTSYTFDLSLEPFEPVAAVCRSMMLLLFVFGLILVTRNIIKG